MGEVERSLYFGAGTSVVTYSRITHLALSLLVLTLVIAACAPAVTPTTPTTPKTPPTPTATTAASPPTEPPTPTATMPASTPTETPGLNLRSSEETVLELARTNISWLRQASLIVMLSDAEGKPLSGAPVRVEQTRHRFPFGTDGTLMVSPRVPLDTRQKLEAMALGVFNHFLFGLFTWKGYEAERGKPDHEAAERAFQWASRNQVTVEGTSLIYTPHHPEWFYRIDNPDEKTRLAEGRVRDIVSRFRGRVHNWKVLNEPTFAGLLTDPYARPPVNRPVQAIADYAESSFRWARESDPSAILLINETGLLNGTALQRHEAILRELKRRSTPFDGLGVQAHMGLEGNLSLEQVWATLTRLAEYGPIYITEVTVPSQPPGPQDEAWRRPRWWDGWTEQAQADYIVKLYTVFFGHPAVRGINYWDFAGAGFWRSAPLVRQDLTPRPAYEALKKLIREEWWTRWEGSTDEGGTLRLHAFYGDHTLAVTLPDGREVTFGFTVQNPDELIRLSVDLKGVGSK